MEEQLASMISEAEDLYKSSRELHHIPGASKLERKLLSEVKCLHKFKKGITKQTLENQLKSTNLTNLRAVLKAIENSPQVLSVLTNFFYEGPSGGDSITVDAVVTSGYKWIKVVSRKPLAVHSIWMGEGKHGDKDILTMAKEYIMAGDQNPVNYESPDICFVFPRGVTQSVHNALQATGVHPIGRLLPDPDFSDLSEWKKLETDSNFGDITDICADFTLRCTSVNLDVTTLIVLTANITNGECNYTFREEILTKLAFEEQNEPALAKLQDYLRGKQLICCRTAYNHFQEILATVGGPLEKQRAEELFKTIVTIVEDEPAHYAMELEESGSIKHKSKVIFGTGEALQAITTTANTAFVRAAGNQGVRFSAYFHASRALTEMKQEDATPNGVSN